MIFYIIKIMKERNEQTNDNSKQFNLKKWNWKI